MANRVAGKLGGVVAGADVDVAERLIRILCKRSRIPIT